MVQHDRHGRRSARNRKRLGLTLLLVAAYMVAEIAGGLLTNSLALLADAGHMLSDVAALALSLFALWIAEHPASPQRTYGYYRAEILAAMANGAALVAVAVFIFIEAYRRWLDPPAVQGALMLWVAAGGLAVNVAGLLLLRGAKDDSLNIRGAWLHVMSDALGSIGAIVAAGLIWGFDWCRADPAASAVIGLLVITSSWQLLAESVSVLMENAPRGIDVDGLRDAMAGVPGVVGVHDLHVWTITSGIDSLSAHVAFADGESSTALLTKLRTMLHDRFHIEHVTIQMEPADFEERASLI